MQHAVVNICQHKDTDLEADSAALVLLDVWVLWVDLSIALADRWGLRWKLRNCVLRATLGKG